MSRACNVLMIYPRFQANTFWNFSEACKLLNARYPTAPLGLITVRRDAAGELERSSRQPQYRRGHGGGILPGPTW